MQIQETEIPGCYVIGGKKILDHRGWFLKSFSDIDSPIELFRTRPIAEIFWTISGKDVARGLHFQTPPYAVDKYVSCITGSILDIVLDLRCDLPSFGKTVAVSLSDQQLGNQSVVVPRGCAHGFLSLSNNSIVHYLQTGVFVETHDHGIAIAPYLQEHGYGLTTLLQSARDESFGDISHFSRFTTDDWLQIS